MDFPERLTIPAHTITIRPRYCETDQAGVVHHSVYPVWFEMGRTELLRVNGVAYKELEAAGILFVVAELNVKYRLPAHYDQVLELTTECSKITPARIEHSYKLTGKGQDAILAEGKTILACVSRDGKVRRIPEFMYLA